MLRRIIDFAKLTDEVIALLVQKYPEGIDEDDIFSIQNGQGHFIRVVEVKDESNIYLVKVSSKLDEVMEDFDEDELGSADPDELEDKL